MSQRMYPLDWPEDCKTPNVFLIYKRYMGHTALDTVDIVCICSSKEICDRRLRGLRDRAKTEDILCTYYSEKIPVDHLFAVSEQGLTVDDGTIQRLIDNNTACARYYEEEINKVKLAARQKIEELEKEIEILWSQVPG